MRAEAAEWSDETLSHLRQSLVNMLVANGFWIVRFCAANGWSSNTPSLVRQVNGSEFLQDLIHAVMLQHF